MSDSHQIPITDEMIALAWNAMRPSHRLRGIEAHEAAEMKAAISAALGAVLAVAVPMAEAWELSAADTEQRAEGAGQDYNQGVAEGLRICAKDLRAALDATPAAVEVPAEDDPAALLQLAYLVESGRGMIQVERKEIADALRGQAATPAAAPTYIEVRECSDCGHIGINDADGTKAACNTCEWQGESPVEDKCPGCNTEGTMTTACPKCGARTSLIAETTLQTEAATPAAAAPDMKWRELFWAVARALNCLPSTSVDANAHVYLQAEKYAAIAAKAPAAAAPVVLPEPVMNEEGYLPCPFCGGDHVSLSTGEQADGAPWYYVECENCTGTADPEKWNERALLAGVSAPAAQAGVADEVNCVCGASWLRHGANDYEMTDTPRKAQADARDALTPAKPVHPKGMTSINARLSFNMGWMACERHHGIRAEDVEQAVATDAAIAAAKGE